MRVLVTGATGLIGRALCGALLERGDEVRGLSRSPAALLAGVEKIEGDPAIRAGWMRHVEGCDAIVHLAGESIGGRRWSAAYKERLLASRVESTRNLVAALATAPSKGRPTALVCASGADYYPFDESDRAYGEDSPPGDTFLAGLCVAWEREAQAAAALGVRAACLRTGVVLAKDGGALGRMALPFRWFAGGPIGFGRQWLSWVHLDDAVGAYLFALDHEGIQGAVNVVAPQPLRQRDFARALGRALGRPSWAPVPGFALRLAVGELAEYLLAGRRVVPDVLSRHEYVFRHPDAASTLGTCL